MSLIPSQPEVEAALAISMVKGLGPIQAKYLRDNQANWQEVVQNWPKLSQGTRWQGINAETILKAAQERLRQLPPGIFTVVYGAQDYPQQLAAIPDPPTLLFIKHRQQKPLPESIVAVVGTRRPLNSTKSFIYDVAVQLASHGVTVCSGLASGSDTVALQAALDAKGSIIAVLPGPVDFPIPRHNAKLYQQIYEQGGWLVSEVPPQMPMGKYLYLKRNRIIAGLSRAVVIAQAGAKSGTLHTADFALQYDRQVFAVPGPGGHQEFAGSNKLIKSHQAQLLDNFADIADELGLIKSADAKKKSTEPVGVNEGNGLSHLASSVYLQLRRQPLTLADLCGIMQISYLKALSAIGELAAKRLVDLNIMGFYEISDRRVAS